MKCYNCNNEFEGNFCPKCGIPAVNTPLNENPYEQDYTQVNNYQPTANYQQTQNYQPQPYQQGYVQPQQYIPQVPKQSATSGKIAAIVISILVGMMLYYGAVMFGFVKCIEVLDSMESSYSESVDDSYHGIGSSVPAGNFVYTLTSAEYNDTYNGKEAGDGMQYITLNVEVKNNSDEYFGNTAYFTLYNDNYFSEKIDVPTLDYDCITLPPGRGGSYKFVYRIPKDVIKLEFFIDTEEDDYPFRTYKFAFTIDK